MAVPKLGTANYELQMFSHNQAELRQFWRVMRRSLAGLVLLATALSLAAQNLPGVPAGKLAPPFRARDQFAKEQTLSSLMGPNGLVLLFFRSADW